MMLRSGWFARVTEAEQGRFFLLLPIAMGTAILVYFWLPSEPPLWLGGVLVGIAGGGLALGWRHPYLRFIILLGLAGALGFARAEWRTDSLPPMGRIPDGVSALSGYVSRLEPLPTGARILLRAPSIDYGPASRRNVRIKLKQGDALPQPGALVKCEALLFAPHAPSYPGGWQQSRNDYFANLEATGVAVTPLRVIHPAVADHFDDILQTIRAKIAATILATLKLPSGAVAVTLFTGDEQIIPEAERQDFVLSGLAHILAVAGLHVGIVMGLFFFLTRWLLSRSTWITLYWPCKPVAAVAALVAGCGYALLTGAHLPILRSLAMASLVTLGVLMGRRAISLRGLAVAAMVLMLIMPEVVLSASFQMSFSAVAALIAGYEAIHPLWSRLPFAKRGGGRLPILLIELTLTSLLAGGASMPFAAYQFQQITPYWIPANLAAVPLTAFWVMPWGLMGLALIPFHLAWLCFYPMGWGIDIIVWMTRHIAAWPDAQLVIPPVPTQAALFYAGGLAWLCIWRSRIRLAGIGLILLGLGVAMTTSSPSVLVSADAGLIAVRYEHNVFVLVRRKANHFTLEQWRSVWVDKPLIPARCSADICRLGPVLYANIPVTDCGDAKLLVSPVVRSGCHGIVSLDAARAAREGALAAWISPDGKITLRSDRSVQGQRPWSSW